MASLDIESDTTVTTDQDVLENLYSFLRAKESESKRIRDITKADLQTLLSEENSWLTQWVSRIDSSNEAEFNKRFEQAERVSNWFMHNWSILYHVLPELKWLTQQARAKSSSAWSRSMKDAGQILGFYSLFWDLRSAAIIAKAIPDLSTVDHAWTRTLIQTAEESTADEIEDERGRFGFSWPLDSEEYRQRVETLLINMAKEAIGTSATTAMAKSYGRIPSDSESDLLSVFDAAPFTFSTRRHIRRRRQADTDQAKENKQDKEPRGTRERDNVYLSIVLNKSSNTIIVTQPSPSATTWSAPIKRLPIKQNLQIHKSSFMTNSLPSSTESKNLVVEIGNDTPVVLTRQAIGAGPRHVSNLRRATLPKFIQTARALQEIVASMKLFVVNFQLKLDGVLYRWIQARLKNENKPTSSASSSTLSTVVASVAQLETFRGVEASTSAYSALVLPKQQVLPLEDRDQWLWLDEWLEFQLPSTMLHTYAASHPTFSQHSNVVFENNAMEFVYRQVGIMVQYHTELLQGYAADVRSMLQLLNISSNAFVPLRTDMLATGGGGSSTNETNTLQAQAAARIDAIGRVRLAKVLQSQGNTRQTESELYEAFQDELLKMAEEQRILSQRLNIRSDKKAARTSYTSSAAGKVQLPVVYNDALSWTNFVNLVYGRMDLERTLGQKRGKNFTWPEKGVLDLYNCLKYHERQALAHLTVRASPPTPLNDSDLVATRLMDNDARLGSYKERLAWQRLSTVFLSNSDWYIANPNDNITTGGLSSETTLVNPKQLSEMTNMELLRLQIFNSKTPAWILPRKIWDMLVRYFTNERVLPALFDPKLNLNQLTELVGNDFFPFVKNVLEQWLSHIPERARAEADALGSEWRQEWEEFLQLSLEIVHGPPGSAKYLDVNRFVFPSWQATIVRPVSSNKRRYYFQITADPVYGLSPLAAIVMAHRRGIQERLNIITWLIRDCGADVLVLDNYGFSALHWAQMARSPQIHLYLQQQIENRVAELLAPVPSPSGSTTTAAETKITIRHGKATTSLTEQDMSTASKMQTQSQGVLQTLTKAASIFENEQERLQKAIDKKAYQLAVAEEVELQHLHRDRMATIETRINAITRRIQAATRVKLQAKMDQGEIQHMDEHELQHSVTTLSAYLVQRASNRIEQEELKTSTNHVGYGNWIRSQETYVERYKRIKDVLMRNPRFLLNGAQKNPYYQESRISLTNSRGQTEASTELDLQHERVEIDRRVLQLESDLLQSSQVEQVGSSSSSDETSREAMLENLRLLKERQASLDAASQDTANVNDSELEQEQGQDLGETKGDVDDNDSDTDTEPLLGRKQDPFAIPDSQRTDRQEAYVRKRVLLMLGRDTAETNPSYNDPRDQQTIVFLVSDDETKVYEADSDIVYVEQLLDATSSLKMPPGIQNFRSDDDVINKYNGVFRSLTSIAPRLQAEVARKFREDKVAPAMSMHEFKNKLEQAEKDATRINLAYQGRSQRFKQVVKESALLVAGDTIRDAVQRVLFVTALYRDSVLGMDQVRLSIEMDLASVFKDMIMTIQCIVFQTENNTRYALPYWLQNNMVTERDRGGSAPSVDVFVMIAARSGLFITAMAENDLVHSQKTKANATEGKQRPRDASWAQMFANPPGSVSFINQQGAINKTWLWYYDELNNFSNVGTSTSTTTSRNSNTKTLFRFQRNVAEHIASVYNPHLSVSGANVAAKDASKYMTEPSWSGLLVEMATPREIEPVVSGLVNRNLLWFALLVHLIYKGGWKTHRVRTQYNKIAILIMNELRFKESATWNPTLVSWGMRINLLQVALVSRNYEIALFLLQQVESITLGTPQHREEYQKRAQASFVDAKRIDTGSVRADKSVSMTLFLHNAMRCSVQIAHNVALEDKKNDIYMSSPVVQATPMLILLASDMASPYQTVPASSLMSLGSALDSHFDWLQDRAFFCKNFWRLVEQVGQVFGRGGSGGILAPYARYCPVSEITELTATKQGGFILESRFDKPVQEWKTASLTEMDQKESNSRLDVAPFDLMGFGLWQGVLVDVVRAPESGDVQNPQAETDWRRAAFDSSSSRPNNVDVTTVILGIIQAFRRLPFGNTTAWTEHVLLLRDVCYRLGVLDKTRVFYSLINTKSATATITTTTPSLPLLLSSPVSSTRDTTVEKSEIKKKFSKTRGSSNAQEVETKQLQKLQEAEEAHQTARWECWTLASKLIEVGQINVVHFLSEYGLNMALPFARQTTANQDNFLGPRLSLVWDCYAANYPDILTMTSPKDLDEFVDPTKLDKDVFARHIKQEIAQKPVDVILVGNKFKDAVLASLLKPLVEHGDDAIRCLRALQLLSRTSPDEMLKTSKRNETLGATTAVSSAFTSLFNRKIGPPLWCMFRDGSDFPNQLLVQILAKATYLLEKKEFQSVGLREALDQVLTQLFYLAAEGLYRSGSDELKASLDNKQVVSFSDLFNYEIRPVSTSTSTTSLRIGDITSGRLVAYKVANVSNTTATWTAVPQVPPGGFAQRIRNAIASEEAKSNSSKTDKAERTAKANEIRTRELSNIRDEYFLTDTNRDKVLQVGNRLLLSSSLDSVSVLDNVQDIEAVIEEVDLEEEFVVISITNQGLDEPVVTPESIRKMLRATRDDIHETSIGTLSETNDFDYAEESRERQSKRAKTEQQQQQPQQPPQQSRGTKRPIALSLEQEQRELVEGAKTRRVEQVESATPTQPLSLSKTDYMPEYQTMPNSLVRQRWRDIMTALGNTRGKGINPLLEKLGIMVTELFRLLPDPTDTTYGNRIRLTTRYLGSLQRRRDQQTLTTTNVMPIGPEERQRARIQVHRQIYTHWTKVMAYYNRKLLDRESKNLFDMQFPLSNTQSLESWLAQYPNLETQDILEPTQLDESQDWMFRKYLARLVNDCLDGDRDLRIEGLVAYIRRTGDLAGYVFPSIHQVQSLAERGGRSYPGTRIVMIPSSVYANQPRFGHDNQPSSSFASIQSFSQWENEGKPIPTAPDPRAHENPDLLLAHPNDPNYPIENDLFPLGTRRFNEGTYGEANDAVAQWFNDNVNNRFEAQYFWITQNKCADFSQFHFATAPAGKRLAVINVPTDEKTKSISSLSPLALVEMALYEEQQQQQQQQQDSSNSTNASQRQLVVFSLSYPELDQYTQAVRAAREYVRKWYYHDPSHTGSITIGQYKLDEPEFNADLDSKFLHEFDIVEHAMRHYMQRYMRQQAQDEPLKAPTLNQFTIPFRPVVTTGFQQGLISEIVSYRKRLDKLFASHVGNMLNHQWSLINRYMYAKKQTNDLSDAAGNGPSLTLLSPSSRRPQALLSLPSLQKQQSQQHQPYNIPANLYGYTTLTLQNNVSNLTEDAKTLQAWKMQDLDAFATDTEGKKHQAEMAALEVGESEQYSDWDYPLLSQVRARHDIDELWSENQEEHYTSDETKTEKAKYDSDNRIKALRVMRPMVEQWLLNSIDIKRRRLFARSKAELPSEENELEMRLQRKTKEGLVSSWTKQQYETIRSFAAQVSGNRMSTSVFRDLDEAKSKTWPKSSTRRRRRREHVGPTFVVFQGTPPNPVVSYPLLRRSIFDDPIPVEQELDERTVEIAIKKQLLAPVDVRLGTTFMANSTMRLALSEEEHIPLANDFKDLENAYTLNRFQHRESYLYGRWYRIDLSIIKATFDKTPPSDYKYEIEVEVLPDEVLQGIDLSGPDAKAWSSAKNVGNLGADQRRFISDLANRVAGDLYKIALELEAEANKAINVREVLAIPSGDLYRAQGEEVAESKSVGSLRKLENTVIEINKARKLDPNYQRVLKSGAGSAPLSRTNRLTAIDASAIRKLLGALQFAALAKKDAEDKKKAKAKTVSTSLPTSTPLSSPPPPRPSSASTSAAASTTSSSVETKRPPVINTGFTSDVGGIQGYVPADTTVDENGQFVYHPSSPTAFVNALESTTPRSPLPDYSNSPRASRTIDQPSYEPSSPTNVATLASKQELDTTDLLFGGVNYQEHARVESTIVKTNSRKRRAPESTQVETKSVVEKKLAGFEGGSTADERITNLFNALQTRSLSEPSSSIEKEKEEEKRVETREPVELEELTEWSWPIQNAFVNRIARSSPSSNVFDGFHLDSQTRLVLSRLVWKSKDKTRQTMLLFAKNPNSNTTTASARRHPKRFISFVLIEQVYNDDRIDPETTRPLVKIYANLSENEYSPEPQQVYEFKPVVLTSDGKDVEYNASPVTTDVEVTSVLDPLGSFKGMLKFDYTLAKPFVNYSRLVISGYRILFVSIQAMRAWPEDPSL